MGPSTRRRARSPIIALVAAVMAVVAPGVAHAAPPANDDFDTATVVTALPFATTQDASEATKAGDDPTDCFYWSTRSVWFSYTAPADDIVKAAVSGSGWSLAVYTGERGSLTRLPGACTHFNVPSETVTVTAGATYHFLLEGYGDSPVTLDLRSVPPSPNDDFAAATVSGLPATHQGNLARATVEAGEAPSSCDAAADKSVWYRYTPDRTRFVAVEAYQGWGPGITVYRGATQATLTEVDCVPPRFYVGSVFAATAGETYHIRVADDAASAAGFALRLTTAPALAPRVHPSVSHPSVFDDVAFHVDSGDSLGKPLVSGEVRFGDGASAPITGSTVEHRYAADGEYRVEVTGSTADGRTGTGVSVLRVETHDVTLSDLTVPASARVGQTKPITVSVGNNTGHGETVEVELLRLSEHGHFNRVGTLSQWVSGSARVGFPFAYTFTAADAAAGGVTFKAVATVLHHHSRDDNGADNELVATTATVRTGAG
ncbi:PKD domain-containing protein [Actinokineospora sp. 24-640]